MKNNYLLETADFISLEHEIDKIISKTSFTNAYKSVYDLEEDTINNALEDLDTYNFLSDKKIVIIKNCFSIQDKKKLEHLFNYINNFNQDNLLILTTKKIDNRLSIAKDIKNNDNIEFIHIELDAYKYIKQILKEYEIDNSSINLLIELCKNDITKIDSECHKLMLYKLDDKTITSNDVNNLVVKKLGDSNEILFSLIKYIILKDKKNALKKYNEILEYNIDDNSIIGLMASQIKLTYQIKLLSDDNLSNQDIINKLKLKSLYQIKKIKEYIYQYSYSEIFNFIHQLSDIDYKIKSGKIDSNLAVEMLILNL